MPFEVLGKGTQDRVGDTGEMIGGGQPAVQAADGHADRPHGALGGVPGPDGVFLLVLVNAQQFALHLGFHRLDLGRVIENSLELELLAPDGDGGKRSGGVMEWWSDGPET